MSEEKPLEATASQSPVETAYAPIVSGISNSEKRRKLWLGIEQLGRLAQGWDTYGASPIDKRALGKAHEIGMALIPREQSFALVPCSDGGVQIEWHRDDFDVEIYIAFVERSPTTHDCHSSRDPDSPVDG